MSWDTAIHEHRKWGLTTFDMTADEVVLKFKEEAKEFLDNPSGEEAADCIGALLIWAELEGLDMHLEFTKKLEICKQRTYERRPNGTYHHVRQAEIITGE